MILLKSALLLGVKVLFGAQYLAPAWGGAQFGWSVRLRRSVGADVKVPGPLPPDRCDRVACLVGADGVLGGVARSVGLASADIDDAQGAEVIGLIASFEHHHTPGEEELHSFVMTRQKHTDLFLNLTRETGATIEDIVYM